MWSAKDSYRRQISVIFIKGKVKHLKKDCFSIHKCANKLHLILLRKQKFSKTTYKLGTNVYT